MLFFIIFVSSFLFLKYIIGFEFTNNQLFLIWIISVCSLTLSLTFFFANYRELRKEQNKLKKIKEENINKDKKELFNALNRGGENVRKFFKDLTMENKDIFEINAENKIIIEYLKIRELDLIEIKKMGKLDIAVIKEKYFKLLQEYFHIF